MLKDLLVILKEYDMWSMDTKYLQIFLDTRCINDEWYCTIKDRKGKEYLSLDDLKKRRKSFEKVLDN